MKTFPTASDRQHGAHPAEAEALISVLTGPDLPGGPKSARGVMNTLCLAIAILLESRAEDLPPHGEADLAAAIGALRAFIRQGAGQGQTRQ